MSRSKISNCETSKRKKKDRGDLNQKWESYAQKYRKEWERVGFFVRLCVQVWFEIGHEAYVRAKPTPQGFTHDWEVFVRGAENTDIHYFVEKVVFHLHETFTNPIREIKEPPYSVKECGYAGFNLPIDVYFKNKDEPKKVEYNYDLYLQSEGPPVKKIQREKFTFPNPSEDFRRKLIRGGGVGVMGTDGNLYNASADKSYSDESQLTPLKHSTPVVGGKPKPSSDPSKKHKSKDHRLEEPRTSNSFADLFGPPIKKEKVSPEPKKSHQSQSKSSSASKSNKAPEKSERQNVVSNDKVPSSIKPKHIPQKEIKRDKDTSIKDEKEKKEKDKEKPEKSKDKEKSKEKSHKRSSSPPKLVKEDAKKCGEDAKEKEKEKYESKPAESKGEKKKKDKKNRDEKVKKEKHKDSEKVSDKSEKREKDGGKEREKDHKKSPKEPDKVKEKDKKEKDKHKEKHKDGEKEKQKHKHKKKDKEKSKKGKEDKEKDKSSKEKRSETKNEIKDKDIVLDNHEETYKRPPSTHSSPFQSPRSSPSPVKQIETVEKPVNSTKEKQRTNPLSTLLEEISDHESSDSITFALSADEIIDAPKIKEKPVEEKVAPKEVSIPNKLVGDSHEKHRHENKKKDVVEEKNSGNKSKSKDKSQKKEKKSKSANEEESKDKEKKRKRKRENKIKDKEHVNDEPVVKSQRISEECDIVKEDKPELPVNNVNDVKEKFTKEYISELQDLQHKIMTLDDVKDLQKIAKVIEETGQFETTSSTFDFDLCALDKETIKRIQSFLSPL